MASRLRHALRRTAVSAIVLAAPLAAAGTAQAAIAGASPGATNDRPDLVSAHLTAQGATTITAQACIDKTVALGTGQTGAGFNLVGYRANNNANGATPTATVDGTNDKCVDLAFPSSGANGTYDLTNDTALHVVAGAVTSTNLSNAQVPNLADSTALVDSNSRSGITAKTLAPNLQGIMNGTALNTLVFVFDKYVVPTQNGGNFAIVDQQGNICTDTAESYPSAGGNTSFNQVLATFTSCNSQQFGSGTVDAGNAVEGVVFAPGQRNSNNSNTTAPGIPAAYDQASFAPLQTQLIPGGQAVASNTPVLTGAALTGTSGTDADRITYTFNQAITSATGTDFHVVLSNGQQLTGNGSTFSGNSVTVSFSGNLAPQQEFAVQAWAAGGAVRTLSNAQNGNQYNLPMSTNVGGNPGGFARGFTTAPDVFGVQLSSSTGAATIFLDQRTTTVNIPDIRAFSGLSTTTPTAPLGGSATVSGGTNAGPEAVRVTFPAGSYSAIQFLGNGTCHSGSGAAGAFRSTLNSVQTGQNATCDASSIDQVLAPTSTAAIAHAVRVNAAQIKKEKSRKSHKARRHARHARKSHRRA